MNGRDTLDDAWASAMRAGNFEAAWTINDRDLAARIEENVRKHEGPRHRQHIWAGESLKDARVLVRCYHGLGDTIQFIRFAAPLRRIAREVIVWVQPELLNLVARVRGVDRCLPLHDGTPAAAYDVDIEIMELAFALRTSAAELARDVPYLSSSRASRAARNVGQRVRNIGLVWRAGDWDTRRSIDLGLFAPLAAMPRVRLHLLQPLTASETLAFAAHDLASPEIDEAASRIQQLDLVLTVDTMMAHLAGALAVPVWTMLCRDCDWRWGHSDTTAWYPTMRLLRQPRTGDWKSVIHEVTRALSVV